MIKIPVVPVTANVATLVHNVCVGDKLDEVLFAHIVLSLVVILQPLIKIVLLSVVVFFQRVKNESANTRVEDQNK